VNSKPLQNWTPEVQTTHGWRAIILQIAMATLASGAIAYVATNPQQLARADAISPAQPAPKISPPPPPPPPPALQTEPVTFANPFDATEVFQFPSGTSETEARQSVAELLMQRARERKDVKFSAKHADRLPRRDANAGIVSNSGPGNLSQTTIR
jgi:hypothetical protein